MPGWKKEYAQPKMSWNFQPVSREKQPVPNAVGTKFNPKKKIEKTVKTDNSVADET